MEPFIKEEMITDTKIVIAPHEGHMGVLMMFHRLIFKTIFNRGSLSPVGKMTHSMLEKTSDLRRYF